MTDPTKYTVLTSAKLGDTDDPVVRVATQVSATGTTITTTSPGLVDDSSTKLAVPLMIGIKYTSGTYKNYVELIEVTAISTDGKTLTVVRGITPSGKDYTDGAATRAKVIPQDSVIEIVHSHQQQQMTDDAIQGNIASGANNFRVGDLTDSDIAFYAQNADTNKPFLQYDASENKWVFSNDGVSTTDVGGGTGSITAGDGIDVTAGVVSTDLATDSGLEIDTAKLQAKVLDPTSGILTGGTSATAVVATWTAVSDGTFTISIDNVKYDLTSIDFSSGVTTMADVATKIQTAIRTATSSTETVAWSTDHFLISSITTGAYSAVSVTSAEGTGTDISGVGATTFMDCETAVGTPTDGVLGGGILRNSNGLVLDNANISSFIGGDGSDGALNVTSGTTTLTVDKIYNYSSINISSGATLTTGGALIGKVLRIKCLGNCTIEGTIDLDEKGNAGASGGASIHSASVSGNDGDSALPKMLQPDGNGGTKGTSNDSGGGGSGATYISKGTDGTNGASGALGGTADEIVANNFFDSFDIDYIQDTNFTKISLGQGGAGGASGGGDVFTGISGKGGDGGIGGGSIFLTVAGNIDITSATIDCNGEDGEDGGDGTVNTGAGGGGGAGTGGTILILYNGILTGSATLNVAGGTGGTGGTGFDGVGGDGGNAGTGKSLVEQNLAFN